MTVFKNAKATCTFYKQTIEQIRHYWHTLHESLVNSAGENVQVQQNIPLYSQHWTSVWPCDTWVGDVNCYKGIH